MDVSEVLYNLIYKRSFRKDFDKSLYPDFENLDLVQLEKSAQAVISQFLSPSDALGFQSEFKTTLKLWSEIFPADEKGIELVIMFLESDQFRSVENVASKASSPHLFVAFREFLLLKLPINEKFKQLRESLK